MSVLRRIRNQHVIFIIIIIIIIIIINTYANNVTVLRSLSIPDCRTFR